MDQNSRNKLLELEQIIGIISAGLLIAAAFIPWGHHRHPMKPLPQKPL